MPCRMLARDGSTSGLAAHVHGGKYVGALNDLLDMQSEPDMLTMMQDLSSNFHGSDG